MKALSLKTTMNDALCKTEEITAIEAASDGINDVQNNKFLQYC